MCAIYEESVGMPLATSTSVCSGCVRRTLAVKKNDVYSIHQVLLNWQK